MPQDERAPISAEVSPAGARARHQEILDLMAGGEIEVKGRIPWSSNATYLVSVCGGDGTVAEAPAIYKPSRGERPLWDFPRGLWKREVAAYELDVWLGWGIVPPTVARPDAPLGPGSLQYCIDARYEEHYFTLLEGAEHDRDLRRIAAFDIVVNNADRKAGHCLLDGEGRVWAIDNGLSFHCEPKLRTVIWDFAGEPIDSGLLASLAPLSRGQVPAPVAELLTKSEVEALVARAARARRSGKYPKPATDFPYPWPLI